MRGGVFVSALWSSLRPVDQLSDSDGAKGEQRGAALAHDSRSRNHRRGHHVYVNLCRARCIRRGICGSYVMGEVTPRTRGRKWMRIREQVMSRDGYLCQHCVKAGKTEIAKEVDHIIPLHKGGTDETGNLQGLCIACHERKSVTEMGDLAVSNHPDWLEPSAIPLTIVCGPPASGKTTHVNQNAKPNDIVICLDTIMAELDPAFRQWREEHPRGLFNAAIRERNRRLGLLKNANGCAAWFIVAAPTRAERDWWQSKLGGDVLLIDPGAVECKRRALARGTPRAAAGVNAWHMKAKQYWEPKRPKPKPKTGLDGWPTE